MLGPSYICHCDPFSPLDESNVGIFLHGFLPSQFPGTINYF